MENFERKKKCKIILVDMVYHFLRFSNSRHFFVVMWIFVFLTFSTLSLHICVSFSFCLALFLFCFEFFEHAHQPSPMSCHDSNRFQNRTKFNATEQICIMLFFCLLNFNLLSNVYGDLNAF